ncbi:hypothetical protein BKA62DRAFT_703964, partial [Auriculariales sp. MPI-PUGE-AT-0066]
MLGVAPLLSQPTVSSAMAQLSADQQDKVQQLMVFIDVPETRAISALQRVAWNVEQAANNILNMGPEVAGSEHTHTHTTPTPQRRDLSDDKLGALNAPPPSPQRYAGLAGEDDHEMQQALKESMNTPSARTQPPTYQDQQTEAYKKEHWQVAARSDAPVVTYDHDLNRALEASLTSTMSETHNDSYLSLAPHERKRAPDRPAFLRGKTWETAVLSQLLQIFAFIPQVVDAFKDMKYLEESGQEDLQRLQRVLAHIRHSDEASVPISEFVDEPPDFWDRTSPREHTSRYLDQISTTVGHYDREHGGNNTRQLFSSLICDVNKEEDHQKIHRISIKHDSSQPSDLYGVLMKTFHGPHPWKVFVTLPHVLAIEISHMHTHSQTATASSALSSTRHPLRFPATLYPDRFHLRNRIETQNRLVMAHNSNEAIAELKKRRGALTEHNGRNTLKDLRGSLHYLAELASDKGDPARKVQLEAARNKMSKIIALVENELESIDAQTKGLEKSNAAMFDTEDMQQNKYDLRGVLVNDGVNARTHLWTYFKDPAGKWWKVNDVELTEVDERTVLEESIGLHLGGGPYMLFYARVERQPQLAIQPQQGPTADTAAVKTTAQPQEPMDEEHRPEWPDDVMDEVKRRNERFAEELARAPAHHIAPSPMDLS